MTALFPEKLQGILKVGLGQGLGALHFPQVVGFLADGGNALQELLFRFGVSSVDI